MVEVINSINDKGNKGPDIDFATVSIGKDAAKELSKGMQTVASQVGLGASMVGIATAVSKGIAKTTLPPVQKAGVIIGSGLIAGIGQSILSNINRNKVIQDNILTSTSNTNKSSDNLNKFISDTTSSSPLENLLFDVEALNYICLSLVFILIIQILFKFYLKDNLNLNMSKFLGANINNKAEYYLNIVISLNKKMSFIYIWLILIALIVGLYFSCYASSELYNNLDNYIAVHSSLNK